MENRPPAGHTYRSGKAQHAFQPQTQRWNESEIAQQQGTRHQGAQQAEPANQEYSEAVQWPQQQHQIVARLQAAQEQQATRRHNEALRRIEQQQQAAQRQQQVARQQLVGQVVQATQRQINDLQRLLQQQDAARARATQREIEGLRSSLRQQQLIQRQGQASGMGTPLQDQTGAIQAQDSPFTRQGASYAEFFIEPASMQEGAVSPVRPQPALEHGQTSVPTDDDANLDNPDGDIDWEHTGYDFGSEPEERSYDGWGCHHRYIPLTVDSMHDKWFKIPPWEKDFREVGIRIDCTGCFTELLIRTKEQAPEAAWECRQCSAVHCDDCVKTAKARIRKWKATEDS
ncbi:uncharacterized protein AB675_10488 [Cyphellophora attinorum]|uniref:Uncharacterized protein n=1 Tax=Cyphellophora attinorum TaxID=1664694 RepID=A0A0N1NWW1_9EURO|nr:uncharacterized protein AB675_10488 [Phialophora attinorum]KPI35965.1 hypothetical protein AB675_10488 [Phialophora attinorum]